MKHLFHISHFAALILLLGCRQQTKPAVQKEVSVMAAAPRLINDARLGSVTSVGITVSAAREMKKAPNLVAWTITDQKGEVYRSFDLPDGKGGKMRTAIFVRGLDRFNYTPSSNITFNILFPLDQIPTNGGAVYLEGSVDVGLSKPEAFRIQVR